MKRRHKAETDAPSLYQESPMSSSRTQAVFFALAVCVSSLLGLASLASAKLVHENESKFHLQGISWITVDNSAGPSNGRLYVGEFDLGTAGSRVYQVDATGTPTGVELEASETPAGSIGFFAPPNIGSGPVVDGSGGANAGRIYVPDLAHGVVDLFGEDGRYVCQITGAATASASECAGAGGSETPRGAIESVSVAVDPVNGELAVGDTTGVVYLFGEDGAYDGELSDSRLTMPRSLAFDSLGRLYVANARFGSEGSVVRYSLAGAFELELPADASSVAVDSSSDHVYLVGFEATRIEEFDSAGNNLTTFGGGGYSAAVNAGTRRLYVGRAATGEIWSGPFFRPEVKTGEATGVIEGSATLHGTVDPESGAGGTQVESCRFEYGPTDSYGRTAPCLDGRGSVVGTPGAPIGSSVAVHADLVVSPGTNTHYRLVAENEEGNEGRGEDLTFSTPGPAGISGESSSSRVHEATVKAQIDPFGYQTSCEVQYVPDAAFQASGFAGAATVPCDQTLEGDFEEHEVSAYLPGLAIGTTYDYRFVARNESAAQNGLTVGELQSLSTFGIKSFSVEFLDSEGNPYINSSTGVPYVPAGGHPYEMRVRIDFPTTSPETTRSKGSITANLRTANVLLPPGLIGNPTATAQCPVYLVKPIACPVDAQIGYGAAYVARAGAGTAPQEAPIFNLVPPRGVAAQLGGRFNNIGTVRIDASVRTGSDYGVNTDTLSITADDAVSAVELRLWGVPADEGHDETERFCDHGAIPPCSTGSPLVPFLTNPTACTGPLSVGLSVDSWQDPGNFVSKDSVLPPVEGCGRLHFDPTITAKPDTTVADSPSGLHVNLHLPQNQNPLGLAEAELRDAVVTLPKGLVVNPSSAGGLGACSEAEIELHGPEPATCPNSSKLGNVEIHTPLLDHPVTGGVYLARQGENPFHSLVALYIAVYDPISGVVVKLPGQVELDPASGQVTARFKQNPQLPFEDLDVDLFGGSRASLTTPATCGNYTTNTNLTPWTAPEGKDASPADAFTVGGNCPATEAQMPNAPAFQAGTTTPLAGTYSPFVLNLSRQNGSQRFSRIDTTLPEGLIGKLAGVATCSDSQIAAAVSRGGLGQGAAENADPSCPAASEVGTVNVGAGSGSPYYAKGHVYLGGPYKGAPLSLEIVTPAVAGPFDLGTVAVRTALYVDESTAQIHAVSDPIPSILDGIPLDVRAIELNMSRPEFTRNPTSCESKEITGWETSTLGQGAELRNHFQVGGCKGLEFKPKLKLSFTGQTKRTGFPGVKAVLTQPKGENANIAGTTVILPKGMLIANAHINNPCTRVQFNSGALPGEGCPAKSILGTAKVWTPLLDKPEEGKVYFRSNGGERELPDLAIALRGQVPLQLLGFVDSVGKKGAEVRRVRTRFLNLPDAPVSRFELKLSGGKKGLLQSSKNLCKLNGTARYLLAGQNGKTHDTEPKVQVACGKHRGKGGDKDKRKG